MKIVDIAAISEIAKSAGVMFAVDNTFSSPYLKTLALGADLVMHSVTKYLSGHRCSDGCSCTNDTVLHEKLAFILNSCGANPGPQDCFLVLRGIKTLHLRMKAHCENGKVVANFCVSIQK